MTTALADYGPTSSPEDFDLPEPDFNHTSVDSPTLVIAVSDLIKGVEECLEEMDVAVVKERVFTWYKIGVKTVARDQNGFFVFLGSEHLESRVSALIQAHFYLIHAQ